MGKIVTFYSYKSGAGAISYTGVWLEDQETMGSTVYPNADSAILWNLGTDS
jgi:hypothetical protein